MKKNCMRFSYFSPLNNNYHNQLLNQAIKYIFYTYTQKKCIHINVLMNIYVQFLAYFFPLLLFFHPLSINNDESSILFHFSFNWIFFKYKIYKIYIHTHMYNDDNNKYEKHEMGMLKNIKRNIFNEYLRWAQEENSYFLMTRPNITPFYRGKWGSLHEWILNTKNEMMKIYLICFVYHFLVPLVKEINWRKKIWMSESFSCENYLRVKHFFFLSLFAEMKEDVKGRCFNEKL